MTQTTSHKGTGHRQRLREKFLASGLSGFHDYEIIELLLTLATPRKDCKAPAKAAMAEFKTLQGVLNAAPEALCRIDGIGPKNLFGIRLVKAVADRCLEKELVGRPLLANSTDLLNYLNHTLRDRHRETFAAIFMDAKNRVIVVETLSEGSLTESPVYPREVVARALAHHAAALICCHNHPSGEPEPSRQDIAITRKLVMACKTMGITVHEHIIVGERGHFSFADNGYMAKFHQEAESLEAGRLVSEKNDAGQF
ncbi:RadC family protein [Desulfosudis oleivorans]|uniref:DNA repair protein RadC n=1 Tax=Desulfosudis oleivorans (strain DSM 6200 / JCM 39069 / Hxd3) TaxID=96561 RepID=A8ZUS2_DESOH|nr:DNA repair protein RadC [Desulfosudis oleivorans]ABW66485.1 DNA repair protein RadC [Desulfosudis oleivorans Hxd3]